MPSIALGRLVQVQRCTLLSIKTGGCPETCTYCSQSTSWSKETGMKVHTAALSARPAWLPRKQLAAMRLYLRRSPLWATVPRTCPRSVMSNALRDCL